MGSEILTFVILKLENNKFYHHKNPIFLKKKDVNIEKVLVSNKIFIW